jgi:hypothetical protein
MQRFIITCVIAGLIAGILVGGFHSVFTAPVMARAIALEEELAAQETPVAGEEGIETPVPLWVQERIGLPIGNGIAGLVFGLIFAGGFVLLRRAFPEWHIIALAAVVGALGFWAIALFPFIKYPLNPPGVGEGETLLFRQLMQTLFFVLSGTGIAGLLVGIRRIRQANPGALPGALMRLNGLAVVAYAIFAIVIGFAFPSNPDPVPVPVDMLSLFRTLTIVGHFFLWALMASGVALALLWQARSQQGSVGDRLSATAGRESGQ